MKSATEFLLYRTNLKTWERGQKYADEGKFHIREADSKHIKGVAFGTQEYEVELRFQSGGISKKCTCPVNDICKHMVGLAIVWDEMQGITRPSQNEVKETVIPPPLITRHDINKAYRNPLFANLDVIRLASSEMGNWSRPHAKLPAKPKQMADKKPTKELVEKWCSTIRKWANRKDYDIYFCAGEMTAAFCEIARYTKTKWHEIKELEKTEIIKILKTFEDELIFELIDDSDGLHFFTSEHIAWLEDESRTFTESE